MSFDFNPSKATAPVRIVEKRQECTTYESAMSYIKDRVWEQKDAYNGAEGNEEKQLAALTWVQKNPMGDGYVVTVNLKTMPIFWNAEETNRTVTIYNPDMTVRQERKEVAGMSRYPVASIEEGIAFMDALASGENDGMNECVRRAADAYKDVVDIELPHINQRAEQLYSESDWVDSLGAWGQPNTESDTGRMVISKPKTNKMNQYKQLARRQLGYKRWADTIEVHRR